MATWQVQEAKARLSELIDRAATEGPQTITRHGKPSAVLLSVEEYRLIAHKMDFETFLLTGPKFDDLDLYIERSTDTGRDIDL